MPEKIKKTNGKNKKTIKIEFEVSKLIKVVLFAFVIISLLLTCYFVSNDDKAKYTTDSGSDVSEPSSNGNTSDVLSQAKSESESISDDQRLSATKISVDEYIDLYNGENDSLVLISREGCQYCEIAVPIIENIIYESGVNIRYIDAGSMTGDDQAKLVSSDEYFSKGYGTPLLMVVGSSTIKDKIEGVTSKENYEKFFKQYGFME